MIEVKDGLGNDLNIGDCVAWHSRKFGIQSGSVQKVTIRKAGLSISIAPFKPSRYWYRTRSVGLANLIKIAPPVSAT